MRPTSYRMRTKPTSYEEAGVSVERGDAFAQSIAKRASSAVGAIGGFAGGLQIDLKAWNEPVLLSTTDGVGTKLMVAKEMEQYGTVGIDLVAMCVNDLAVCGADPLHFLDYIACGRIDQERLSQVMDGIIVGCEEADAVLAGGETAEMPDMYGVDDIDLAGFAVGIVEKAEQLPRTNAIEVGDLLVGLASSGIHSNGFSLARKVLTRPEERALLLEPTRIYVRQLRRARGHIKAAAHITGGGVEANVSRVLPKGTAASLLWNWHRQPIFELLQNAGVSEEAARGAFNLGVGVVMVVSPADREALETAVDEPLIDVGVVAEATGG